MRTFAPAKEGTGKYVYAAIVFQDINQDLFLKMSVFASTIENFSYLQESQDSKLVDKKPLCRYIIMLERYGNTEVRLF